MFVALFATFALGASVALVASTHCARTSETRQGSDDADMTRALQLRVKHSDAVVEFHRCGDECPQRRAIESRIRQSAADHNAILSRHPTWTLQPLDTKVLIR